MSGDADENYGRDVLNYDVKGNIDKRQENIDEENRKTFIRFIEVQVGGKKKRITLKRMSNEEECLDITNGSRCSFEEEKKDKNNCLSPCVPIPS